MQLTHQPGDQDAQPVPRYTSRDCREMPWFFGLHQGDGNRRNIGIANLHEREVLYCMQQYAALQGMKMTNTGLLYRIRQGETDQGFELETLLD